MIQFLKLPLNYRHLLGEPNYIWAWKRGSGIQGNGICLIYYKKGCWYFVITFGTVIV